MLQRVAVLALSFFLVPTYASPLTEHAMAVSQGMSAFYMFSLSEGDERYKEEYQTQFKQANDTLAVFQQHDEALAITLKTKWDKLAPYLKFDYVEGAGFILPMSVRVEFREYLNTVYLSLSSVIQSDTNLVQQLHMLSLNLELMSALFFDIASMEYGSMALSTSQGHMNPAKMAQAFNEKLRRLQTLNISAKVKRNLRAVETKWQFIEDTVINYKGEAAVLLVYFNKRQIHKLFTNSEDILAGI